MNRRELLTGLGALAATCGATVEAIEPELIPRDQCELLIAAWTQRARSACRTKDHTTDAAELMALDAKIMNNFNCAMELAAILNPRSKQ